MPRFGSTDRRDIVSAGANVLERGAGPRQVLLPSERKPHAAGVAMKERGPELIFEIADPAANRRFLYAESTACLAETSIFGGSYEITQMVELDVALPINQEDSIRKGAAIGAVRRSSAGLPEVRHYGCRRA